MAHSILKYLTLVLFLSTLTFGQTRTPYALHDTLRSNSPAQYVIVDDSLRVRGHARLDSVVPTTCPPTGSMYLWYPGGNYVFVKFPDCDIDTLNVGGSGGTGEVNTMSNLAGAGVGIYKSKTGVNFDIKRLKSLNASLTIADSSDSLVFNVVFPDSVRAAWKADTAGKADTARSAGIAASVPWSGVTSAPDSFRAALKADSAGDVEWSNISSKPSANLSGSSGGTVGGDIDITITGPSNGVGALLTSATINATMLSGLTAKRGGTGQTAFTIGDMLYSFTDSTLDKLAGNTTTTPMYLRSTGTGTVATLPEWAAFSGLSWSDTGTVPGLATAHDISTKADLSAVLKNADSTAQRTNSNYLYQSKGTYLIPSDSTAQRTNSAFLYQAKGTYLVPADSTEQRSASAALYQPKDADLTTLAGLTATTDNFIVSSASAWASRTPTQVRTTLGLVIGTNVQAYDADLTTYAGITPSANVQTLLGSADYAAFKTSLSLNSVENTALSTWAGSTNLTTLGTIGTGTWNATLIGVAKGGTGTATTFTAGSVVFAGASGVYSQDNANLFWDDTNNRLGIGTTSPLAKFVVSNGGAQGMEFGYSAGITSNYMESYNRSGAAGVDFTIYHSTANATRFYTSGAEKMRIHTDGNVGIGTTSPLSPLNIDGTTTSDFVANWAGGGLIRSTDAAGIDKGGNLGFGGKYTAAGAYAQFAAIKGAKENATDANASGYLAFFTRGASTGGERVRIDGSGNVGIGTTSPGAQLHTTSTVRFANFGAGAATFDASGNISSVSDERLKDIRDDFKYGLSALKNINPIIYRWNKDSGLETEHDYAGFSAQNVRDNIPLAVGQDSRGYLTLQDRAIMATLVNAVNELSARVDSLKAIIRKE